MSDSTLQRILRLAGERFGRDPAALKGEDDLFTTLEIDSVQALDLLSDLERTFGVDLPDYEMAEVRTFSDLAERIQDRL